MNLPYKKTKGIKLKYLRKMQTEKLPQIQRWEPEISKKSLRSHLLPQLLSLFPPVNWKKVCEFPDKVISVMGSSAITLLLTRISS